MVGTLGVNVRVGSGVFVGAGVSVGSGVFVGTDGVSVKAMTGASVAGALTGRLQDDTTIAVNKNRIINLCFILSPLKIIASILGDGCKFRNGKFDNSAYFNIGILMP
jgi:UDP-3-O-[3-hydroxymyristoyl] glucosamine N-acyltransferase